MPSRNLDEDITYNYMALMSLRSHSHVQCAFIYTQLYKITSKYYFKIYFNGTDEARTHSLLLVYLMSKPAEPQRQLLYYNIIYTNEC